MKRPNPVLDSLSWRDEVGNFLNNLGLTGEGVEIGSCEGKYAFQVLSGTSNYGKWKNDPKWAWKGHLTCVDLWENQPESEYIDSANLRDMAETFEKAKRVIGQYGGSYLKAHSLKAAKYFTDERLDWVYIDANHAYQATDNDIHAWYPKVKPGGLFSGHDFYTCHKPNHPDPFQRTDSDVARAVLEFSERIGTWPHITACRSWWFIKPIS